MLPQNELPTVLRSDAAAELLGLSIATLAKWRVSGGGPPYAKAGRCVLYVRDDLIAWLKSNRRLSTSQL